MRHHGHDRKVVSEHVCTLLNVPIKQAVHHEVPDMIEAREHEDDDHIFELVFADTRESWGSMMQSC